MAWLRGLSAPHSAWVRRSKCENTSLLSKLFFSGDCELPSLPEPDEEAGTAAACSSRSSFGREGAPPGAFGRLREVAAAVGAKPRIHHRRIRVLPGSWVHVGVLLDRAPSTPRREDIRRDVDAANIRGISMTRSVDSVNMIRASFRTVPRQWSASTGRASSDRQTRRSVQRCKHQKPPRRRGLDGRTDLEVMGSVLDVRE
jgi:hypothetical protein